MKPIECYEIDTTDDFDKAVERFVTKKNFKKLPHLIEDVKGYLAKGDFHGNLLFDIEKPRPIKVYKLRLPNPDANVGKSGGFRLIYAIETALKFIVLTVVYYKKEQAAVSEAYITGLINGFFTDFDNFDDDR